MTKKFIVKCDVIGCTNIAKIKIQDNINYYIIDDEGNYNLFATQDGTLNEHLCKKHAKEQGVSF